MSSSSLPQKSRILRLLGSEDRARHAREIMSELDLQEGLYSGLVRFLDDMVYEGELAVRPGHRYALAKDSKKLRGETVEGYLSMTPRGAGFVSREGGDVYISPEGIGGAMHGDKVIVSIVARGTRGPEGEVESIVERSIKRVAGVLRRRGKSAWLDPDDTRIRGPIILVSAVDRITGEGNRQRRRRGGRHDHALARRSRRKSRRQARRCPRHAR